MRIIGGSDKAGALSYGLSRIASRLTTHDSRLTTHRPMNISLISSPYYLGHRDVGMGAGPTCLLQGGAVQTMQAAGHDVSTRTLEFDGSVDHEVGATFAINALLAEQVRRATAAGAFPIVLAGNCCSCLGTVAGSCGTCGRWRRW